MELLVSHPANVRYLTGFSGSNGLLLLGRAPEDDLLATDGRYVDQAAAEVPDLPTLIDRQTVAALVAARPFSILAVEESLSVGDLGRVRGAGPDPLVAPRFIEDERSAKDAEEIALLSRACAITADALDILAEEILVGMAERVVARRLEQLFAELGAEDRAFPTIVATGAHAAIPHHRPGETTLRAGDLVVVDAGARVEGYHADMTRTFIVGEEPASWQTDLHAAVLAAQRAGVEACQPGAECWEPDAAARAVLREAGLEERFTHGLGHGVGLEIHEAPGLGPRATGSMRTTMAVTVEPGVYLPGRGGVRIEDTLVVTDAGPRVLTESPRGLRVVGV